MWEMSLDPKSRQTNEPKQMSHQKISALYFFQLQEIYTKTYQNILPEILRGSTASKHAPREADTGAWASCVAWLQVQVGCILTWHLAHTGDSTPACMHCELLAADSWRELESTVTQVLLLRSHVTCTYRTNAFVEGPKIEAYMYILVYIIDRSLWWYVNSYVD